MNFEKFSKLEGTHAPFSPSQPYWLRYDDDKAIAYLNNKRAAERGTKLHEWAKTTIDLGIKQPRSNATLYAYVNDAIGFHMSTEVTLRYSDRIYGTADAISFRKNKLRVHDLKTGRGPVHREQLIIYVALFCLQYHVRPADIYIECRIYQNDSIDVFNPTVDEVLHVMDRIEHIDKIAKEYDNPEV